MIPVVFETLEQAMRQMKRLAMKDDVETSDGEFGKHPVPDVHVEVSAGRKGEIGPLTCPKCGASVQPVPGRGMTYCSYCGTGLLVDDGSATVTYRTVDETRIRELEAEQLLELKRLEIEEQRRPGRVRLIAFLAVLGGVLIVVGAFAGHESGDSNSPWYVLEVLGIGALVGVAFLWSINLPKQR